MKQRVKRFASWQRAFRRFSQIVKTRTDGPQSIERGHWAHPMVLENLITTSSQYYWSVVAPGRGWEVFNSNDASCELRSRAWLWGRGMKARISVLILALLMAGLLGATSTPAGPTGYAYCGTYGSYVLLYKSNDQFEELGKLRCGEKVEVLSRWFEYAQVRTLDGRVGWVHFAELSNVPGAAPTTNFGLTDPSSKVQGAGVPALNNASIVKLRNLHVSADVILAKIQSSRCEFDTTPAALQKLKVAGVPDKVILAMVTAPSASAPPPAAIKAPEIVEVKIPGGTVVDVELSYAVSSDDAVEGRVVLMTVAQDVVVDGVTVIQHGAEAHGQVTTLKQPGFMNRPPGTFSWTMDYVVAVNSDHVPTSFYSKEAAENPMSSIMGAPGPSWEFKKGKPAVIAAKTRFQTVIRKSGAVVRVTQPQGTTASVEPPEGPSGVQAAGPLASKP
jgi:hypothetical protein